MKGYLYIFKIIIIFNDKKIKLIFYFKKKFLNY